MNLHIKRIGKYMYLYVTFRVKDKKNPTSRCFGRVPRVPALHKKWA